MNTLTACPEPCCHEAAEVAGRFVLPSTDGPIEHAQVRCVTAAHGPFRMPVAMLEDTGRLGIGEPKRP